MNFCQRLFQSLYLPWLWIRLQVNSVYYLFLVKYRKLLYIRNLYSKPTWQRTDFVNTRTWYLPSKASLISVSELSDLKTTALTLFSFRLDTWYFFKEIKEKITRQTVSTNSLSPCRKRFYNVTLSRSSWWSQRLMYLSTTTLIHSDSFEIKLLEQNILFRLTCVVSSLRRVPV